MAGCGIPSSPPFDGRRRQHCLVVLPRRFEAIGILQRGRDRGELSSDIDGNMLLDTLYGPLYFRMLAGHGPLSNAFIDHVCDTVMDGVMSRNKRP